MKHFEPKIALINIAKNKLDNLEPPLGILSIASYALHSKIIIRKNLVILDTAIREPLDFLRCFKPDLVGISAMTPVYLDAEKIGRQIKKSLSNIPIIIGGFHISSFPEQLEYPFDIGVIGEGEETFFELVRLFKREGNFNGNNLRKIKGSVFRKEDMKIELTGDRVPITPLDKIPPLDWSLLPETYFRLELNKVNGKWRTLKQISIFSARGCPYRCVFCSRRSVFSQVRYFSVKRTVDEIEKLVKNYAIEAIHFHDDTFTLSKERVRELIKELRARNLLEKIVFPKIFARADTIDREFIRLLKEMNVVSIIYGFESGSNRVLKYLKNDTVTVADNKKAAALTDEYDIGIIGGFMLGSPNETKGEMKKTIDLMSWMSRKENVVKLHTTRTAPFPGTKLWEYAFSKGLVSDKMDWNLTELFSSGRKAPQIFFNEKISYDEYSKFWSEADKLCSLVAKRNKGQKGALRARSYLERKSSFSQVLVPIYFIKREIINGRFIVLTLWIFNKIMQHLLSIRKFSMDLAKVKTIITQ